MKNLPLPKKQLRELKESNIFIGNFIDQKYRVEIIEEPKFDEFDALVA